MEEKQYLIEDEGITLSDLLQVLFGRKILLLIVTLSLFIISTLGILFYNSRKQTYSSIFEYNLSGFQNNEYLDGTRFDVRDLITLEKLNEYKESSSILSNLDMEKIYYKNAIMSFKYEELYVKNEQKINKDDVDYLLDKEGFRIVLKKRFFTEEQAQALVELIAKEPVKLTKEKIEKVNYTRDLLLYNQSKIYDLSINYLENQYYTLINNYSKLINEFGDLVISDSEKISDRSRMLQEYFQNYSFSSLRNELNQFGYVKDFENYESTLLSTKESLTLEKKYNSLLKDELIEQRKQLIQLAGSMYSVELTAYNEKIISLSARILEIDKELELLEKKLKHESRVSSTDPSRDETYVLSLESFEQRLDQIYQKLTTETEQYTALAKEVVNNNSFLYFDNNSVVVVENPISRVKYIVIAFFCSLLIGLIVNLCVDFKKLTREYRRQNLVK